MIVATLTRLNQFIFVVVGLLLLAVAFNRATLTQYKVGVDLRRYASAVRHSKLALHDKERLLDVIERIEDRVWSGEQIGFVRWYQHAQAIREMLDGGIEGDELRLIERELKRSENDFKETEHD